MKILLIEDDKIHCEEYERCAEYLPYTIELNITNGCEQGIKLTQDIKPDVILLDLELHNSDKDGLLFLNDLKKLGLEIIPYIIIITQNTSHKTYKFARYCGADYIFPKTKPDYSPHLVLDFAYNYYSNQQDKFVSDKKTGIETEIIQEMDRIGIANGMGGRRYIIEAILLIIHLYPQDTNASSINLGKHIYPIIAKKYKKSTGSIEQGIKNAIQKAWLITDMDTLASNYTVMVSYRTGYPNNKDFIFYYVDKIKDKTGHD